MQQTEIQPVDGIVEAFNSHDVAAMSRYYHEDARVWLVGIKSEKEQGGFEIHARLMAAMPDASLTVVSSAQAGDTAFLEWIREGTHTGQFEHLMPTRNTVKLRGASALTLRDGKVAEERIYMDSQDLYGQLAVPRKRSGAVS